MLCPAVAVLGTSDLRTARMLAWLRRDLKDGSCSTECRAGACSLARVSLTSYMVRINRAPVSTGLHKPHYNLSVLTTVLKTLLTLLTLINLRYPASVDRLERWRAFASP